MGITTGHQALINRIVTMPDPPNIVLPNGPGKGLPRYVIQVSGGAQQTATLQGLTDSTPEIVVQVETEDGGYTTENDTLVEALVARFPVASRFDGVCILESPMPRAALPVTDGVYSVPVIIRGSYTF